MIKVLPIGLIAPWEKGLPNRDVGLGSTPDTHAQAQVYVHAHTHTTYNFLMIASRAWKQHGLPNHFGILTCQVTEHHSGLKGKWGKKK